MNSDLINTQDDDDEDFNLEDAWAERVDEILPGRQLTESIELDEPTYSLERKGEIWIIWKVERIGVDNPVEAHLTQHTVCLSLPELLSELSCLDFDYDDVAYEFKLPSRKQIEWDSAIESLPGEYLGDFYVESLSGSWRSDWSVKQDNDETWMLYAVYEPVDRFGDVDVMKKGRFKTREEAVEKAKQIGFGGLED